MDTGGLVSAETPSSGFGLIDRLTGLQRPVEDIATPVTGHIRPCATLIRTGPKARNAIFVRTAGQLIPVVRRLVAWRLSSSQISAMTVGQGLTKTEIAKQPTTATNENSGLARTRKTVTGRLSQSSRRNTITWPQVDRRPTILVKMEGKNEGLARPLANNADQRLSPLATRRRLAIRRRLSEITSPLLVVDKSITLLPADVEASA